MDSASLQGSGAAPVLFMRLDQGQSAQCAIALSVELPEIRFGLLGGPCVWHHSLQGLYQGSLFTSAPFFGGGTVGSEDQKTTWLWVHEAAELRCLQ